MIVFSILMIPPLVFIIITGIQHPELDAPSWMADIWWMIFVLGNTVLYYLKKSRNSDVK